MSLPRRPRKVTPPENRTEKEKREARRILEAGPGGPKPLYDPNVHPIGVVQYFRDKYDQMEEVREHLTKTGQIQQIKKSISPPSLAGYAAEQNLSVDTIFDWAQKYEEFGNAVQVAKSIQQHMLVELTLQGAYNPHFAQFVLKNLQGWSDKVDVKSSGSVTLNIDEQDSKL
jgi:hypothetical protein